MKTKKFSREIKFLRNFKFPISSEFVYFNRSKFQEKKKKTCTKYREPTQSQTLNLHTHEDSSSISLLPISFTRTSQPSSRAHVSWRSTLGVATRVSPLVITVLGPAGSGQGSFELGRSRACNFHTVRPVGLVNVRMIARSLNSAQRDWDEEGRVRDGRMEGGASVGCTLSFVERAYAIFETLPAPLMHISPLLGPSGYLADRRRCNFDTLVKPTSSFLPSPPPILGREDGCHWNRLDAGGGDSWFRGLVNARSPHKITLARAISPNIRSSPGCTSVGYRPLFNRWNR